MRTVDLFRALREYDEAKYRLERAEDAMGRVRSSLKSSIITYPDGSVFVTGFHMNTQHIIDTISEFKKAYYAYENLFIDHEYEQQLLDLQHEAKVRIEMIRHFLEMEEPS